MILGDQNLFCLESKARRNFLERINRGAVHVGLANLAQLAVAHGNAETGQRALQGCRAAIHRGRLDHFGYEEAAAHGCSKRRFVSARPVARHNKVAGESYSISISILPIMPCWSGMRLGFSPESRSSTRTWPSRTSSAM